MYIPSIIIVYLKLLWYRIRYVIGWIRWGHITATIRAIDAGVVSEIEYTGRWGRMVGYWAYGTYDPQGPYKGQPCPTSSRKALGSCESDCDTDMF